MRETFCELLLGLRPCLQTVPSSSVASSRFFRQFGILIGRKMVWRAKEEAWYGLKTHRHEAKGQPELIIDK